MNTQNAEYVPPEVRLDLCGRQVLATNSRGEPYVRYTLCAKGCGFYIGGGDALGDLWHESCERREWKRLIDGSVP